MPLTPADVHNVVFSKSSIGKRGYHEDEVDAFLDLVEAELTRLIQVSNDLRKKVEQLDQPQRAAPVDPEGGLRPLAPTGPVMASAPSPMREQTSPGGDHNIHAAKVLSLAQEMADRLTSEAKAEADAMVGKARTTSEQVLFTARAKADAMATEVRTRAETMLDGARTKAEALDRQSREKAASLERDAARRHSEIIAALNQEKSTLEKKIDELRVFERGYRTRLKTYLNSQLRELDEHGSVAPTDPTRTQQCLAPFGSGARADTPA